MKEIIKKTVLHPKHLALGAKMASFAGWEMPIQYQGTLEEHEAVRSRVGVFDVSHMGRIFFRGPDAEFLLNMLSTNTIKGKKVGSATYTVWCHPDGGSVDDLIVYRLGDEEFFTVVNAGNRDKDLQHILDYVEGYDVTIENHYDDDGILAVQGPNASPLMAEVFPESKEMPPFHVKQVPFEGEMLDLATTGYTGSGGFEICGHEKCIERVWDLLFAKGKSFGIAPAGLAARDTLRLEMGYALYGHELSDSIAPIESVSSWTVKWKKESFIGKQSLEEKNKSGNKRFQYGVTLIDKGIAREGYQVLFEGNPIGKVTSGNFSPSLKKSIALILVDHPIDVGKVVEIIIRERPVQAVLTPLPFYQTNKKS